MRAKIVVPLLLLAAAAPAAAQQEPTLCGSPSRPRSYQSPVNIVGAVGARMDSVSMHYPRVGAVIVNTGSYIRVNVNTTPANYLRIDGVTLRLEEFHFHWPGEHKVNGDSFPVEIHMVHKSADGHYAVALGTWVRVGAYNPAWTALWNHLPRRGHPPYPTSVEISSLFGLAALNSEQVYRYCGSLTTGQHEEGITWLMRGHPIEMSQGQVDHLKSVMGRWSRVTQPLGNRRIRYRAP
jgi:carbonic anhydrase